MDFPVSEGPVALSFERVGWLLVGRHLILCADTHPSGSRMSNSLFEHPLVSRYSCPEMSFLWSNKTKFSTWRRCWIALAESEKELGLNITEEQIEEMRANVDNIDFERAEALEVRFKHDVMAHIHTYGECCPLAKSIIHLGATSCFVGDNTDLIVMKKSLLLIRDKLAKLLSVLSIFAVLHKGTACLGYTHLQPAQLTTVGKRASVWMSDLKMDYDDIDELVKSLPMRGIQGTTGTQATFLELFEGDHDKVIELNRRVCSKMGFSKSTSVCGQTISRKWDFKILTGLSGIAQSAYKTSGDIRLLASMKEIEEPCGKAQVGSSAMPYKRNPMRSERVCSLARYVIGLSSTTAHTQASQCLERTLDDSACRRMVLPEAFLTTDIILSTLINVCDGLQVWPAIIRARIDLELPFMATEAILMQCVKAGGDRQFLHEQIRKHSIEAGRVVKGEGKPNDLLVRIANDPNFTAVHMNLSQFVDPERFIGRAPQQVDIFLRETIDPILIANKEILKDFKVADLAI